jgi:hypothetical protein
MDPSKKKTVSQRCPQRLSRSAVHTTGRQRCPHRQLLSAFNTARAESIWIRPKGKTVSQCCPQRRLLSPPAATGLQRCPRRKPLSAFNTASAMKAYGSVQKGKGSPSALPTATASQRFQQGNGNEIIWIRPKGRQSTNAARSDCLLVPSARYRPSALHAATASQRSQHGKRMKTYGKTVSQRCPQRQSLSTSARHQDSTDLAPPGARTVIQPMIHSAL